MISLVLVLALPGGAAPAEPGENLDGQGFLTGPAEGEPEDIALAYVERETDSLSLEASDVDELYIRSSYSSSHTGVTHVSVGQRHQGLEIFGSQATVTIATDGSVVFVGGSLVSGIEAAASGAVANDAADAVHAAADGLGLDEPEDLTTLQTQRSASQDTVLADGGISDEPIPATLGWQPTDDGALRLAWELVIDEADDVDLWNAAVDAETGELLNVDNWTDSHSIEELSHLARDESAFDLGPGGSSDPVEDGSSYRVMAYPDESPNDGPRRLVTNPADSLASPFGWHDVDGEDGADYTVTRGNNVHAYTDRDADGDPDTGSDPDGGADLTFDFPLDLDEHPQPYFDATVTNLFYFNNVIHDVMYRLGFDEASGNFQVNNYGRGGTGGDDVRGEAADGGGHNNANFSTPAADGGRPRMQMYLWPGSTNAFGQPNGVTVGGETYGAQYARFTPAPTNAGTAGTLVDAGDGCEPYTVPAGSIVITDESDDCDYYEQTVNAEAAGAVAMVSVNEDGNASTMSQRGSMADPVGIPAVQVSDDDGAEIREELPASGSVHKRSDHPGIRDGDLDNGIIIHEYGHGISNRLTGGLNINCLGGSERMGEGWSDFYAIAMLMNPELDDPDEPRGLVPYILFQENRQGNGLRIQPYSRNLDFNRVTYDNIKSGGWNGGTIASPHGVGWAWASILWDMTWDLVDEHGFNPDIYQDWSTGGNNLAMQLVTDGLKMQGCNPTFVSGRAAIIAADQALTGGENACLLWNAFARRGLGYSAIGGTNDRNDGTEAFDVPPGCDPTFRLAEGHRFQMAFDSQMTEGMSGKIEHALETAERWLAIPGKELVALSHLDRAIHLLLWQADVIDKGKTNQGDADALRALAQTIQDLRDSL